MSLEIPQHQQHEVQGGLEAARSAFEQWTGSNDETRFQRTYLGHYQDREAFGQELLASFGVDGSLARLPDWLRGYVRLDGEAVTRNFEAAGHVAVVEAPDGDGGVHVFDSFDQPARPADSRDGVGGP